MRLLQDYLDVFARQQLVGGLKGYSAWAGQSDEMLLARGRYLLTRVDDDMISTMLQSDEWLAPQAALYLAAILKRTAFVPALRERLAAATNPVVEGVYVAAVVLFNQRKLLAELGAGMDELAEFAMKLIRELPSPNTPRKYRRILNEPLRWGRQLRGAGDPTDLAAFQQDLAAEVLATTPASRSGLGRLSPAGRTGARGSERHRDPVRRLRAQQPDVDKPPRGVRCGGGVRRSARSAQRARSGHLCAALRGVCGDDVPAAL